MAHLRKQVGMSQSKLAEKTGLSQSFLSAMECGTRAGQEDSRREVARALSWTYEAMLELGRRLIAGEDPADAATKALATYSHTPPPPLLAPAPDDLEGFRVFNEGEQTAMTLWIDRARLGSLPRKYLEAHRLAGPPVITALVNTRATRYSPRMLFLVRDPLRLRTATKMQGAFLLRGQNGEVEAAPGPWRDLVVGRVLWYQVDLGLAGSGNLR